VQLYTVAELAELIGTGEGVVRFDGSVYTVADVAQRDDVRGGANAEFQDLVDSVTSERQRRQAGIDDLLGEVVEDLDLDLGLDAEVLSPAPPQRTGSKTADGILPLLPEGFDYDRYLQTFDDIDRGQLRSLMRLSQRIYAICVALIMPAKEGLVIANSIGLHDPESRGFRIVRDHALFRSIFGKRLALYVPAASAGIPELDRQLGEQDRRFIAASLYLPVRIDEIDAYLLVGLRDGTDDLQGLLRTLTGVS
jgi:hypothetical protein